MHDCKPQFKDRSALLGDDDVVVDADSAFEALDAQTKALIDRSLEFLVPVEPQPPSSAPVLSDYDSFIHAKLCRVRLLGLSNTSAARACGISPSTLSVWMKQRPKLALDMDSASELANAHAALLLRSMMKGDGPVAFNAVKFFLSTRSTDFRERAVVELTTSDPADVIRNIREGMYGLSTDLPVLDAVLSPSSSAGDDVTPDAQPQGDNLDFDL